MKTKFYTVVKTKVKIIPEGCDICKTFCNMLGDTISSFVFIFSLDEETTFIIFYFRSVT